MDARRRRTLSILHFGVDSAPNRSGYRAASTLNCAVRLHKARAVRWKTRLWVMPRRVFLQQRSRAILTALRFLVCAHLCSSRFQRVEGVNTFFGCLYFCPLPHCTVVWCFRYRVIPSPLPALKWWRVVVDEAHMVERTTQETAKMALKIPAMHR